MLETDRRTEDAHDLVHKLRRYWELVRRLAKSARRQAFQTPSSHVTSRKWPTPTGAGLCERNGTWEWQRGHARCASGRSWRADTLTTRHYEQIVLQLTGHARAVDVRRRADQLPKDGGPKALAGIVLLDAEGRLSAALEGTVRCVQNRARLVRAPCERLDRLDAAALTQAV
ncbi:hypothetical protein [Streptomyces enissocaesilis]|uniref:hypothetical protein n=1 Tax=Streptomyces enissocaesilis TaxID=332589 RepID=UPI0031D82112